MKTLRSIRRTRSYPARPPLHYETVETPAGPVHHVTDGRAVRGIVLGKARSSDGRPSPVAREATRQLRAYFAGRLTSFDLPLHLEMPDFTTRVLKVLRRIPFGKTRSYGEVARLVGRPRAARAVGQAVGANPLPIVIPCHRVLAADRKLGGFGSGLPWKRFLLELEGLDWR